MISRRQFLAGTTAIALAPKMGLAAESLTLTAMEVESNLVPDQPATKLWGYNGSSPGPVIRAKKGNKINVKFQNDLSQPSAVHWHGIRIDNKMDGVPGLTQQAVEPDDGFEYDFSAPDSGTYWYHSHNRSWEQVARGLYGPLIIDERNPPKVDHDIIVIVDDWKLKDGAVLIEDFENRHDQMMGGNMGNFAKVTFIGQTENIMKNQRVRLRLINVATDRIFPIVVEGITGKIVAFDGMPIASPQQFEDLLISPAGRVDIIADITGDNVTFAMKLQDGVFELGTIDLSGEVDNQNLGSIEALEPNERIEPDIDNAIQATLTMQGGAHSASANTGEIWAFNGKSIMDDVPFQKFEVGQTALIKLVNDTSFPHAIHLHGHHFQAVEKNGFGPMLDTILVDVGQKITIACVFNNKGKWLLHCHMLSHQAAGMKTWVHVV